MALEWALARVEARIDLDALRGNVKALVSRAGEADLMVVVKANAYGHGLVPVARAARAAGAPWLATALPEEALALRAAGVDGRILTWLWTPGGPFAEAIRADLDVSISGQWDLAEVVAAARKTGRTARIHLKIDSGLGRNGCPIREWPDLVDAAVKAQADESVNVVGLWSHLAMAESPWHASVAEQVKAFTDALRLAEQAGVRPEVRHMANSAATALLPDTRFDLVRTGLSTYGLPSAPNVAEGLRPVMTLASRFSSVKRVPAGQGVSYGLKYRTAHETTLGLVPVGYADGIPLHASNRGPVWAAGKRRTVAGRVAMDQFIIDLHGDQAQAGDEVLIFGPGDQGEPTAEDWARAADTIPYEIVTRIGASVPRVYLGER
ncbi:alanine racemase [Actinoplanes sp. TBRC 11911]|uniref:alanine racemase n=1 Tax=Actinoplanes sp. TBRC 11911 TaxID=2729386 RepID=UPI0028982081|nr:alanine racemase [Actinoplanes sp. TBRC 11911]